MTTKQRVEVALQPRQAQGTEVVHDGNTTATISIKTPMAADIARSSGTAFYPALVDKPKVEGVTLVGDKTLEELGLTSLTPQEIDEIIFG